MRILDAGSGACLARCLDWNAMDLNAMAGSTLMAGTSFTGCTSCGWFERGGVGGSGAAVWQPLLAGNAALPPDVGAAIVQLLEGPEVAQLRLCCRAGNALVRGSLTRLEADVRARSKPTRAVLAGLLDAFPAVTQVTMYLHHSYWERDCCLPAPYGGAPATLRQLTVLRVPAASPDLLRACPLLTTLGVHSLARGVDGSDEGSVQQYGAALVGLRHLRELELVSVAVLAPLLEGLRSWTGLTALTICVDMEANTGSELLCGIYECTSLQQLSLWVEKPWPPMQLCLPTAISQLLKLHTLEMWHEDWSLALPYGLEESSQLTLLRLHGYDSLEGPPAALGSLTLLKELQLESCPDEALPSGVWSQLTGLEVLRLQFWPRLEYLPEDIGRLQHLRELELTDCRRLIELPTSIAQLGALRSLSVDSCTKLFQPSAADGSETKKVDTDSGSYEADSVYSSYDDSDEEPRRGGYPLEQHLPLRDISAQPEAITPAAAAAAAQKCAKSCMWQVTQLTLLCFADCKLTALPAGLGRLRNLKELDLSNNSELTALPDGVGQLTGLTQLDLAGCKRLPMLPASLSQLERLQVLNLWSCDSLMSLPPMLDLRHAGSIIREPLNFISKRLNVVR